MARLKTVTLGCKVNQYETAWLREGLMSIGYRDAAEGENPDLCLVNTCTVTGEGDAKSRQTIRRLHRDHPQASIVVLGCYAARDAEQVAALPGVTEVVRDRRELPDLLGRFGVIDLPQGVTGSDDRTRAWVKVQDGCLLRCRYCIIPIVRPGMSSRPIDAIVDEVRRLVERGHREVVLTGIHLGHYGVDFNRGKPKSEWTRLSHLLERLAALDGDFRLRLSSIEATEATRELLDVMRSLPHRIVPHLHPCLQSGSESVLRRMRRRWGAKRFLDRCAEIRQRLDRPALTTDVIVGFPGETEAEFSETLAACREAGFSKIHRFPFGPRPGTPAFDDPGRVAGEVVAERMERLGALESELQHAYARSLVGATLEVLVERHPELPPSERQGTSCRYLPVRFPVESSSEAERGSLVPVTIERVERTAAGTLLIGRRIATK
ncbi:MAG TPA: MiaB/RimO family radical SAM methylthiotransferase [Pirellulaceae bacterium]|nr:MiaB/RimO family radical SAM methylthiotransferase [Pirellulaceae bacterium]